MAYFKYSLYLLFIVLLFWGCNGSESLNNDFFEKAPSQWADYLKELHIANPDLKHRVLLISHTTTCSPCLNELSWWNREHENFDDFGITLIVLEKYESSFHAFLKVNNFTLPATRDSAGIIFEHELIGYPPVKIYFNKKSQITAIEKIGTNGNLNAFLAVIQKK